MARYKRPKGYNPTSLDRSELENLRKRLLKYPNARFSEQILQSILHDPEELQSFNEWVDYNHAIPEEKYKLSKAASSTHWKLIHGYSIIGFKGILFEGITGQLKFTVDGTYEDILKNYAWSVNGKDWSPCMYEDGTVNEPVFGTDYTGQLYICALHGGPGMGFFPLRSEDGGPTPFTKVSGNLRYLVSQDAFVAPTSASTYSRPDDGYGLFENSLLEDASGLYSCDPFVKNRTMDDMCNYLYEGMFKNCKNLVDKLPNLTSRKVAVRAYKDMFNGCESLQIPDYRITSFLPGVDLENMCYLAMFKGCTSLVTPPILPAVLLDLSCYNSMFENCTSLMELRIGASGTKQGEMEVCVANMLNGIPTNGMLYGVSGVYWEDDSGNPIHDANHLPPNWGFNGVAPKTHVGVKFIADGPCALNKPEFGTFMYSTDEGKNWIEWKEDVITGEDGHINVAAKNVQHFLEPKQNLNIRGNFTSVEGDLRFLLDPTAQEAPQSFKNQSDYTGLFSYNDSLVDASKVTSRFHAELGEGIYDTAPYLYNSMFKGCSSLQQVPTFIMDHYEEGLFYEMFMDCISLRHLAGKPLNADLPDFCCTRMHMNNYNLIDTPEIGVIGKNVGMSACESMFEGCTSLESVYLDSNPIEVGVAGGFRMFAGCTSITEIQTSQHESGIPVFEALAHDRAYSEMFQGCTSLVQAPLIRPHMDTEHDNKRRLHEETCARMFQGCTSLIVDPSMFIEIQEFGRYACSDMFVDCTSITSAPGMRADATIFEGCFKAMYQNCTGLTDASALTLSSAQVAPAAYFGMFQDCTNMVVGPNILATEVLSGGMSSMFRNCYSLTQIGTEANKIHLVVETVSGPDAYPGALESMFGGCTAIENTPIEVFTRLQSKQESALTDWLSVASTTTNTLHVNTGAGTTDPNVFRLSPVANWTVVCDQ